MWMIFEDSNTSGICELARGYYKGCEKVHIYGAGGVGNLSGAYAKEAKGDYALLYVDVLPDNRHSIKEYNDLRREFRNNNKVLVVPITCSEFLILSAFTRLECDVWKDLENVDDRNTPNGVLRLEKYYKKRLTDVSKCIHTIAEYGGNGLYFYGDCTCGCDINELHKLDLVSKQRLLLNAFPLIIALPGVPGISKQAACDLIDTLDADFNNSVTQYREKLGLPLHSMWFVARRKQVFY